MTSKTRSFIRPAGLGATPAVQRSSSAAWLDGLLKMFEAEGVRSEDLLVAAGLDPLMTMQQEARFSVDDITRLWEIAIERSGNPALGLSREHAARFSRTGAVVHVMSCGVDLNAALHYLAQYMAVVSDATTFTMSPDPDGVWLSIMHTGGRRAIPRQRVEHALLTLLMGCQWLTQTTLSPLRVELVSSAPGAPEAHRTAFGSEIVFNASCNRLLMSHESLAQPLPTHHGALAKLHEEVLEQQLRQVGDVSVSRQVRAQIVWRLPGGEPRRNDVALALGLSDRTLQRRLKHESTSFQEVLEITRRELAQQLIAERRRSLTDVADALGFVDMSNFFRAFKRWFGLPPAQYRAILTKE